jgi:hypothetical protein
MFILAKRKGATTFCITMRKEMLHRYLAHYAECHKINKIDILFQSYLTKWQLGEITNLQHEVVIVVRGTP